MFRPFSKRQVMFFYRSLPVLALLLFVMFASSCVTIKDPKPTTTTTTTTVKKPVTTTSTTTSTTKPVITTTTTRPVTTTTMTPPLSVQATLHLIIVADTNDSAIGKSVAVDSRNMRNLFENIVSRSNGSLFLNKIVFEGYSVTQENMLAAINSLRVGSNDVIVFLYAGHGHRYLSTTSKWPLMDTLNNPTDFLTIIQKIKNKNGRQFIAIADCCNTIIDVYLREVSPEPRYSFPYENIRRMFLTSDAKFAVSSSKPGQAAYGDDVNGGFFTYAFVENLKKALFSSEGNWKAVFENSKNNVFLRTNYKQEPQYEEFR